MSLYYESTRILSNADNVGGSLTSRIFGQKHLQNSPANVFALVTESIKWSGVLKEVVERSGLLNDERKLDPILATLLVHDLILTRKGIAAPAKHPLRRAVERHKVRLFAEFTKVRIRRGFTTFDTFRESINAEESNIGSIATNGDAKRSAKNTFRHPRWIRINTLKTTLEHQLSTTFAGYDKLDDLSDILSASGQDRVLHVDEHVPNLLALPPNGDISKSKAYRDGEIICQDKASCFPAILLDLKTDSGDLIDACAAPGNKTSHLAAILNSVASSKPIVSRIHAFERSTERSKTLVKMMTLAGADVNVQIHSSIDFLTMNPENSEFAKVSALLLDPSCSGSGIVGRDDVLPLHLPNRDSQVENEHLKSKKRKRKQQLAAPVSVQERQTEEYDKGPEYEALAVRLATLSTFQSKILDHAMHFPCAKRIIYSTCSIHTEENEAVIVKALASTVAKHRGWRLLLRHEQVTSMQAWKLRGDPTAFENSMGRHIVSLTVYPPVQHSPVKADHLAEACIKCEKGTGDGTMGFFVAGFIRDEIEDSEAEKLGPRRTLGGGDDDLNDIVIRNEEEWNGFSDDESRVSVLAGADPQPTSTLKTM